MGIIGILYFHPPSLTTTNNLVQLLLIFSQDLLHFLSTTLVSPHTDPVPSCINHYRLLLTQYHQVPTSTSINLPSTILYLIQISDFFNLTPKYFLPYCLILTWNRLLLTQYHQVPTSTGLYWPSTITYQPVPPYTDPLPPRTNQDRPILTHFHQLPTNTAPYWPSITKYQPTPPHTDPLPPQTNQYRPILAKYH